MNSVFHKEKAPRRASRKIDLEMPQNKPSISVMTGLVSDEPSHDGAGRSVI
jgi:hypothetical protein